MKPSPYLHINRIEIVITEQCNGQCLHCSAAKPNGKLGRAPCRSKMQNTTEAVNHKRLFFKLQYSSGKHGKRLAGIRRKYAVIICRCISPKNAAAKKRARLCPMCQKRRH